MEAFTLYRIKHQAHVHIIPVKNENKDQFCFSENYILFIDWLNSLKNQKIDRLQFQFLYFIFSHPQNCWFLFNRCVISVEQRILVRNLYVFVLLINMR